MSTVYSLAKNWFSPEYDNVIKNIPYNSEAQDDDKQCCDIYLTNTEAQDNNDGQHPVIIFVHGGGWSRGDRDHRWFGVYANLATYFTNAGYIVVVPSYRLSPAVQHPSHCDDICMALKFVSQNIESYGGNKDQVYLMGHSAGAHISSLIALDTSRLEKVGVGSNFIKGCICVSGVYDVSALAQNKHVLNWVVHPAFGVRENLNYSQESPIDHVTSTNIPFLLINAWSDWGLDAQTNHFHEKLKNANVKCKWIHYKDTWTNHLSIIGLHKGFGTPYLRMLSDSLEFLNSLVCKDVESQKK